jgi:hypothetical protein
VSGNKYIITRLVYITPSYRQLQSLSAHPLLSPSPQELPFIHISLI